MQDTLNYPSKPIRGTKDDGVTAINFADHMDGLYKALVTDKNAGVQLPNKVVAELPLVSAQAVTTTSTQSSQNLNVSTLSGRKYIHVTNSHNQSCTLFVKAKNKSGAATVSLGSVTVSNLASRTITATDIPALLDPLQIIQIDFSFATAPTSGSLSAWVEGVSA